MAAPLSFDTAYRRFRRGEIDPVYYLTGDEDTLKDELIALLADQAVDPSMRDFNFDVRSASDLGPESLHTLVETPPMLAERRMVVVRGVDQWRKNAKAWQVLAAYVERPSPSTVLVITSGAGAKPDSGIARRAVHIEVEPLRPDRLGRWVRSRATRVGIELDDEAGRHLIAAVGADLAQLGMEIDKLAAAATGGTVTAENVADLVGVRRGETTDDWIAAVLERDVVRAARTLGPVLATSGNSAVRLVGLLGTALLGARLARTLLDAGRRRGELERLVMGQIKSARPRGIGPWGAAASLWSRVAERWAGAELDAALRDTLAADRALKSTTIADETGILTDLMLKMSVREAA
jgi:DNA polymerase-3 subunit delta